MTSIFRDTPARPTLPVTLLRDYETCPRRAWLKWKRRRTAKTDALEDGRLPARWAKKAKVGTAFHEAFQFFNTRLQDEFFAHRHKMVEAGLCVDALSTLRDQLNSHLSARHGENFPTSALARKVHQFFDGERGWIAWLARAINAHARGSLVNPAGALEAFFGGDPDFEAPLVHGRYTGRADALAVDAARGTCTIWEVKSGAVAEGAPFQRDVTQACAYALLVESARELECTEIHLCYLTEHHEFAFTDQHRERVGQVMDQLDYMLVTDKEPGACDREACRECPYAATCGMEISTPSPASGNTAEEVPETKTGAETDVPLKAPPEGQPPAETTPAVAPRPGPLEDTGFEAPTPTTSPGTSPTPTATGLETREDPEDYGRVKQDEGAQLVLQIDGNDRLQALVREKHARKVHVGSVFTAEAPPVPPRVPGGTPGKRDALRVVLETEKILSSPMERKTHFASMSELSIEIVTRPLLYFENDEPVTRMFPHDFSHHRLRPPTRTEIEKVMNLKPDGVPLGLVSYERLRDTLPNPAIPYMFPFGYQQIGYKGILVLGSQGKGKTTLLKILCSNLAHFTGTPTGLPPAQIIFDVEDQFGELEQSTTSSTAFDEDVWEAAGIELPTDCRYFMIKRGHGPGQYVFSFEGVAPDLAWTLFPELPAGSLRTFQRHVTPLLETHPDVDYATFAMRLRTSIENDDTVHPAQRDAIARAVENGPREFFDARGTPLLLADLFQPGQISVVQVRHLGDAQLTVLLYLLMQVNTLKIVQGNTDPLVLVVDEAHEIFPREHTNPALRPHVRRVARELKRMTRRGRKKNFGPVFASQQPQDIHPDVGGGFQTTIYMGLEEASRDFARNQVGRGNAGEVLRLVRGQARVWCKEAHGDLLVPLYVPRAPNRHEESTASRVTASPVPHAPETAQPGGAPGSADETPTNGSLEVPRS